MRVKFVLIIKYEAIPDMEIRTIFFNFKWQFIFNFVLIVLESIIDLLFPLFIGFAIDGAINGSQIEAIQLGVLGFVAILIGGGRRYFDSRFYAKVYQKIGTKILSKMKTDQPSIKTARLGMIREAIEFMENSLPELIANIIGIFGVIFIIASLNLSVFFGSLIATFLVFSIYLLTSKKTIRLNSSYNDELEKQVDIITTNDQYQLAIHLKNTMKWNVKLSDLEVFNFSISWVILIGFLLLSIWLSTVTGVMEYGALVSLIMYVFQYIGAIISLPIFYQNWLRFKEIKERLIGI